MSRRTGIKWELAIRADQRVLRWFVMVVERIHEYRIARRVSVAR